MAKTKLMAEKAEGGRVIVTDREPARCCSSACDLCWRDQIVALVAPAFAAERGENINLASALPTAAEIG